MASHHEELDFPFPTSFTALLMEGMEGGQAQAPRVFPVQGRVQPLVPFSVLSGGRVRNRVASRKVVEERERLDRFTGKVQRLRRLIPGGGKSSTTAEMLQEAYYYVKFLEAQVLVLRSMSAPAPAGGQAARGEERSSSSYHLPLPQGAGGIIR